MKMSAITARRPFLRALAVGVAGATAMTLGMSSASAGEAQLSRNLRLTASPGPGASASMTRIIDLDAGNYSWTVSLDNGQVSYVDSLGNRSLYLAEGTYTWTCTISSPWAGSYQNTCTLDKGIGPAKVQSNLFSIPATGDYHLISYLFKD